MNSIGNRGYYNNLANVPQNGRVNNNNSGINKGVKALNQNNSTRLNDGSSTPNNQYANSQKQF